MNYGALRVRKHAPWMSEFNRGMMVLGESGIATTYWISYPGFFKFIERERFYQMPLVDEVLDPFTLTQLAATFGLLGIGLLSSCLAFICEKKCE